MSLFSISNTSIVRFLVVFFISASLLAPIAPTLVLAQATTPTTPAAQAPQQNSGGWCSGLTVVLPWCLSRGASALASMGVIYLAGLVLTMSGAFMNGVLSLTTVDFNASVYTYVAPGVQAVWTVFRDIANIIIIGMFTFIALSMILGIEKFNARQMVAKVLLIAVLINFSLLFTRMIIESSNFFAIQFYKAASIGVDPGTGNAAAIGISGKFAQLMGVHSVLETGNALFKAELGWWDPGFMTMALGGLVVIVTLVAALMFFYIAFLLVARTLLFIFLLITSSLAFATYLLPGSSIGGYGWSDWWSSLLKNAVFAPLLLMFLWATIQVGSNIKAISGTGSIGGLLADPTKSGNINALFCYLLIIGMLYVSIKVSSSFSHKIAGLNYAALLPAYGAGMIGRLGGLLGRQTLGRGGLLASDRLAQLAKEAKDGSRAQRMYNFGAQSMGGLAKRDYNLMASKIGKEIGGVAHMKDIAGKSLGGFKGVQDTFKKEMAESAKRLAYTDEEKKAKIKSELEAKSKNDPSFKTAYEAAENEHKAATQVLEQARKDAAIATGDITNRYKARIETLERDRLAAEQAFSAGTISQTARNNARNNLKQAREEQKLAMDIESNRIKRAEAQVNRAAQQFENISTTAIETAVTAGRLPAKFSTAGDIAEKTVKNTFTALLKASVPTQKGISKFAEKVGKEAGKPSVPKNETVRLAREVARAKLGEKPKTP